MNSSSRFSVLCPEVDLDAAHKFKVQQSKGKKDNKKLSTQNTKPSFKTKVTSHSANENNIVNKKKKTAESDLQALAFGFGKSKAAKKGNLQNSVAEKENNEKNKSKGKKRKGGTQSSSLANGDHNPDEDWKKRDDEFVKYQNEQSLREAILQSKLEFEEIKKREKVVKKVPVEEGRVKTTKGNKTKKRKEKTVTLSLDQFNSLKFKELSQLATVKDCGSSLEEQPPSVHPQKFNEEKFFKDVEEATRRTLEKEHRQEQYKANANQVNHEIQVKKFISEIEKRDFEIQALRLEVESLNGQLHGVKSRNKKLCEVISFSEMRSKGELVVELEKAMKGREEFSEEVSRLNTELEQERTKVSHLSNELKKLQGKKRNADSSSK